VSTDPLIHVPLYCWDHAPDFAMRAMVEQQLACLESYFANGNTDDVLVTTNDRRPLEILSAYKTMSGHRFDLRLVSRDELLSVFRTKQSRLDDVPCIRTIFSKFYPILKREAGAIVHVDFDTIFTGRIDLGPLFAASITLVDANKFMPEKWPWRPTRQQAEFFRLTWPVRPKWNWINSGVFAVQHRGFDICENEVSHYLENLERAIADRSNVHTDEIIMNALAVREPESVSVIPDHRYNFLAYFLKHDPAWRTRAQIIHFHSLKPDKFWYIDGAVTHRCEDEVQAKRVSEDVYVAVLMWFRYLHAACRGLPYLFPLLEAIPLDVAERELATRFDQARAEFRGSA
jgi:hypothetical protein